MRPLQMYRLGLIAFMASGLAFALLSLYVNELFLIGFFGNVFLWSWRLKRIKCQKCGAALAPEAGASAAEIFDSFNTQDCKKCGEQL